MNKKIQKENNSHWQRHTVKAEIQSTIKLVQKLKDKIRKMVCNYNIKLKDTHKYTENLKSDNRNLSFGWWIKIELISECVQT